MGVIQGWVMAVQSACSLGCLWGILAIGVYLSFRVLDFPDLTVEGTFSLGGAVGAVLITVHGANPWLALPAALLVGMLAGAVTGLLHTKLGIPGILSGILTMIALYSVNVRVMDKANISLVGERNLFEGLEKVGLSNNMAAILVGAGVSALIILVLALFFKTEIGYLVRATGSNEKMVRALGGSTDNAKILGLMISNGLAAVSGALASQQQGYAKVDMGSGAIVIGLASVIIGEVLIGKRISVPLRMGAAVVGSVLYRIAIASILQLGPSWFKATDLKLFTAILVAAALSIPHLKKRIRPRRVSPSRSKAPVIEAGKRLETAEEGKTQC